MQADITAIIVTFHPESGELGQLLQRVSTQVGQIVVIDNATVDPNVVDEIRREVDKSEKTTLIQNEVNVGLAAALNQGLEFANSNDSDLVVLFDQDSLPQDNFIEELLKGLSSLSERYRVGAVGPRFVDLRNDTPTPFFRVAFPTQRKIFSQPGDQVKCDYLITSGCLIPLSVVREVGGMDEGLFIDNVDMDWSFRVIAKGFQLFGIHDALMLHKIGDRLFRMPMGMGSVMVHSPRRLYYSSRNRVLLYKRPYVGWTWVLQDIPRFLLKFVRIVGFVRPRRANARAMILGFLDGIAGKDGPGHHEF
jgi:rhamnosyltransferase